MNRQTLEEFLCSHEPRSVISTEFAIQTSASFDDRSDVDAVSGLLMKSMGFSSDLVKQIAKEIGSLSYEDWLRACNTYTFSKLPVLSGDIIYHGQTMELHGDITKGEFNLSGVVFSPKEIDCIQDSHIFIYDERFLGVPVFVPFKKDSSRDDRSYMNYLFERIYDRLTNVILFQRKMQATNASTIFDMTGSQVKFDTCFN